MNGWYSCWEGVWEKLALSLGLALLGMGCSYFLASGMWCTEATVYWCQILFFIIIIINNSVSSDFLGEIFWNPNLNRTIRIFHLSIRDRPLSGFGAARGPSVRAAGQLKRVTGHPYRMLWKPLLSPLEFPRKPREKTPSCYYCLWDRGYFSRIS